MARRRKRLSPNLQNTAAKRIAPDLKDDYSEFEYPVFSLKYMTTGKYSLANCDRNDQSEFALRMHRLSQVSWSVIRTSHKHGLGYEKIRMDEINAGRPSFLTPDVESLKAFRFSGKKPMLGHISRGVFYILFIDHDFSLYRH